MQRVNTIATLRLAAKGKHSENPWRFGKASIMNYRESKDS